MKIGCYSIYDRKTLCYHMPYFAPTDGAAVRIFSDAIADPNTSLGRHPNDYVLYFIGSYDDSKALMEPESPLRHVVDASSLVKAAQPSLPFGENGAMGRVHAKGLDNFGLEEPV